MPTGGCLESSAQRTWCRPSALLQAAADFQVLLCSGRSAPVWDSAGGPIRCPTGLLTVKGSCTALPGCFKWCPPGSLLLLGLLPV